MTPRNENPGHQLSLWTLHALIAGTASFGGALAATLLQRASLILGAVVGIACAIAATAMPILLRSRLQNATLKIEKDAPTPSWLRVLYLASVVWILLAAILANRFTEALLFALRASPK